MNEKIIPNLWFNKNAKEAVDFYVSVFPDGKILSTEYYPNTPEEGLADFQLEFAGKELVIEFEIGDMHFTAINAGSEFSFTAATSFAVNCKDQEEIDYFWQKLSSNPDFEQCGWCMDKFGLSWQIVPQNMPELMKKPDAYKNMMQMKKLVIADF